MTLPSLVNLLALSSIYVPGVGSFCIHKCTGMTSSLKLKYAIIFYVKNH